ncbi:hypothetical protein HZC07_05290 [Candidatus Micrarchaeota archaeon]|nr:hypothetical protein [Candidatus Micrarchaeota archaeon]
MDKKIEGALQIIFSIAIIIAIFYFSKEIAALKEYGYIGAFLISALSSATILFPAPGWAVVLAMTGQFTAGLIG